MKCLADTNVYLAVALDEPERQWLIEATHEAELIAPRVLPYEIGNAISALVKRKRVDAEQAMKAWELANSIPVELVEIDVRKALDLAVRLRLYAYDAYFLQCALQMRCPLLTLDGTMRRAAAELNIELMEKP